MERSLNLKRLDLTFLFCLISTLVIPPLLASGRLMFFSPFLVIICYKKRFSSCLWVAFGCGIIMDLLSSNIRLGIHSLNYCLTLTLLYPQKKHFFADSLSTLPIMTFLFSSVSTFLMAILLYSLEAKNMISWYWAFTDLLVMPSMDALFAFCAFIIPPLLFGKPQRRGSDYFFTE